MTAEAELRAAVEAWIADDPDLGDRAELQALLDRAFAADGARAGAEAGAGAEAEAGARPGRQWLSCGIGSRIGCTSGRRGYAAWSPRGRTG